MRLPANRVGFAVLVFAVLPVQADETAYTGVWKGHTDGYDELWTVKNAKGVWSVNGKFTLKGVDVTTFIGTDISDADGKLTFTRRLITKPTNSTNWIDGGQVVAKSQGGNLTYTWTSGTRKGTHAMVRIAPGETAPLPVPEKKIVVAKFDGTWTANVATGFRVVMEIVPKNDTFDISANYYNKSGQLVGNFLGADVVQWQQD